MKQNRWALFVSAKAHLGGWEIGAGLRYEDIDFDYFDGDVWNKEQSKKYHKLFPNISVLRTWGGVQATLSYERKIQNSFTCIVDCDDFETVSGYTLYEDYMSQVMELYNGNPIALMKQENLDGVRDRFFAFSYTPTIGTGSLLFPSSVVPQRQCRLAVERQRL